jgi:methylaspartate mutase sigma subunit
MPRGHRTVLLSTVASDAHTWNLVFLDLLLTELGWSVVNLGPCVPDGMLVAAARLRRPELVVVSSVNGHGADDGERLIRRLRAEPALSGTPVVIGGKLGVDGDAGIPRRRARLARAGFTAVLEGPDAVDRFRDLLAGLRQPIRLAAA